MMHSIIWGVKDSLLQYARAAEGGGVTLDGVTALDTGFAFPILDASADLDAHAGHLHCSGALRLYGHFGMLVQEIVEPRIEWGPAGMKLSVVDPPGSSARLVAWTLADILNDPAGWHIASVRLTPRGTELFGGKYPSGTAFDPIRIACSPDAG